MIAAQGLATPQYGASDRPPTQAGKGARPVAGVVAAAAKFGQEPGAAALARGDERRVESRERPPEEERRHGDRRKTQTAVVLDTRSAARRRPEVDGAPYPRINVEV